MKEELKDKLDKIANVWNYFILKYDFCKRNIKFTAEVKTNYLGDILGYFKDTFDIIFDAKETKSYSDRFASQISFLQSIYVQQDFIEELLLIFRCGIVKGDLKKNPNYFVNRDIRNELVGHPIRKQNGKFISSCLFGYNDSNEKIVCLRYHRDNDYKFESMEFLVSEILTRHKEFLNEYFDKIIDKLKIILSEFIKELENIERLIDKKSFDEILQILSVFYESIFEYDFIYDKESLLKIYSMKDDHKRYQNLIDKFYHDLKVSIKEKKEIAIRLFEKKKEIKIKSIEKPIFDVEFIEGKNEKSNEKERPVTYHYELGKIATKRNPMDFEFFGRCLKRKCEDNEIVLKELEHMKLNMYNDIEYYSAFGLICTELNED